MKNQHVDDIGYYGNYGLIGFLSNHGIRIGNRPRQESGSGSEKRRSLQLLFIEGLKGHISLYFIPTAIEDTNRYCLIS